MGYSYGGLIPAAVPATTVAGCAGPGGGALSGVYLGALGRGGWGGGGGGSGSGGGFAGQQYQYQYQYQQQQQHQQNQQNQQHHQQNQQHQQQPVYPLSLPPVSPASATSSGRFVFGVSPASATSSTHQRGAFSVASSVTSGSELTYSPSGTEMSSTGKEVRIGFTLLWVGVWRSCYEGMGWLYSYHAWS